MKQNISITYGVDVIVGTLFQGEWKWYLTEKEIWMLDDIKYAEAFDQDISDDEYADPERINIPILDEKTASIFLQRIEKYRVSSDTLQYLVRKKCPFSKWDDISEMFPSIFVNFDKRELWSVFPEPNFCPEDYVPEGWIGKYEDFYELIPIKERYWIIDGHDYIKDLADT